MLKKRSFILLRFRKTIYAQHSEGQTGDTDYSVTGWSAPPYRISGFCPFFHFLYLFFRAGAHILKKNILSLHFFEQREDDDVCRDLQPVSDTDVF